MLAAIRQYLRSATRFEWAVVVVAFIAVAMSLYYLTTLVIAEQVFNGVCGIFWTMGRALLNGYTLYEDIFETKPPLPFVMSALSLKLFGNEFLGYALHTVLLFAVPLGLAAYAKRRLTQSGTRSAALMLVALFFGTLLVRYLSRHPTAWAIEFYGLGFTMLYVLTLADSKLVTWRRSIFLTIFLIGAIGMKESFLLVMLSCAFVVASTRSQWIRGVLVPIVLTAVIGVAVLAFMGSLHAYLSIYLPEMFGYYVQRFYIPFLLKGLAFDKVFGNIGEFSWGFLLLLGFAFLTPLFVRAKTETERMSVWIWVLRIVALLCLSLASATSFIFQTTQGFLLVVAGLILHRLVVRRADGRAAYVFGLISALLMVGVRFACPVMSFVGGLVGIDAGASVCVSGPSIATILVLMTIPTVCALAYALRLPRQSDERPLLLAVMSLLGSSLIFYIVILSHVQIPLAWTNVAFPASVLFIGYSWWRMRQTEEGAVLGDLGLRFIGLYVVIWSISMATDFQGHHFLSVIPFLLAIFLPVLDVLAHGAGDGAGKRHILLWLGALSIVIILNPLRHPSLDDLPGALKDSNAQVAAYQLQAERIDDILDHCNLKRYLVLGAGDVYSFTKHTPNNFFLWAGIDAVEHHPTVRERTLQSITDSDIIFIGNSLPAPEQMSEADKGVLEYIQKHFTQNPWTCAADVTPPDDLYIFYRTDRAGEKIELRLDTPAAPTGVRT